MKCTALVLAAGKGTRMNSSVSKQFMELDGFPLVYYALRAFEQSMVDDIILVTGQQEIEYCRREIVEKYQFQKVRCVTAGGSTRYLSVYNGLCAIQDTDIVLVHDGARPFVTDEIIERTVQAAVHYGSGVAAVRAKDTVKLVNEEQFAVQTPSRDSVWLMQTPQTFSYAKLCQAYETVLAQGLSDLTDDAMVLEAAFHEPVRIVEGSYRNIKVTTPEDMEIAAVFCRK
ncbi:MAG: 2-C-methyl-D-erythritol 4-phosphate cytidylyltransferase [Eubacterium sp.]|nr:2-C-methyl-D-erythritol 4-phosphate cytidylyltransferase [Eubacterium sp.]